jgi:ATP-dependent helicase HrpA
MTAVRPTTAHADVHRRHGRGGRARRAPPRPHPRRRAPHRPPPRHGRPRPRRTARSALAAVASAVDAAEQRVANRRAAVPAISYPAELPVSARREDIAAAIRDNQVVIVAGETGSGKTTQIPKICLELGRGVRGMIGTPSRAGSPRAPSPTGSPRSWHRARRRVGWKVRFTDQVGEGTLVKLMTDGILLAELTGDRMLRRYDTLIIDEAHERSLNIDFILGYLTGCSPAGRTSR